MKVVSFVEGHNELAISTEKLFAWCMEAELLRGDYLQAGSALG